MKIPEKAPDWWYGYKKLNEGSAEIYIDTYETVKDIVAKANKDYLYWDKVKYLPVPEDINPEEVWSFIKHSRKSQQQGFYFHSVKGGMFSYWIPPHAQKQIYLIGRGMEKVLAGVLEGQAAKGSQLNSIMEEAIASSQIEGAATTRAVAKEMLGSGRTPANHGEMMIANNFKTIALVKEHLDESLTEELLKNIHASMTEGTLEDPAWEGEFRIEQNEVQDEEQNVLFIPPPYEEVNSRMARLCQFANEEGEGEFIHPFIKGIILHFWLAYVHPFMDGNGRTARALFYWYMLKHDYPLFEYLSISSVIKKKKVQYLKSFLYSEIDESDLTYFIMFHLKAIEEALDDVVGYIKRKKVEKQGAMDFLKHYPSLNDRQLSLLADALDKPEATYTFEKHLRLHGIVRQSARTDLLNLRDLGLLDMRKEGRKFVFMPASDLREKLRS